MKNIAQYFDIMSRVANMTCVKHRHKTQQGDLIYFESRFGARLIFRWVLLIVWAYMECRKVV